MRRERVEEPTESCNLLVTHVCCCRLGAYACQHACTWHSGLSSDKGWPERCRTMGEVRCAFALTLLASIFSYQRIYWKHCSDAYVHAFCPTLCPMRARTSSVGLSGDACQHAFSWQSRPAPERVWLERKRTMREDAAACDHTPLAAISSYQRRCIGVPARIHLAAETSPR